MANFLGGLLKSASSAAPFAAKAIADVQASRAAERDAQLRRLMALNQDRRAEMDQLLKGEQELRAAQTATAQIQKLRQPNKTYDPVRGALINETAGTVEPLEGLPARVMPNEDARTAHNFTVDGTPTVGSMDKQGRYYDASGNPVSGTITPFVSTQPSFTTFQDYDPENPGAAPTTRTLNTKTGEAGEAIGRGKQGTQPGRGSAAIMKAVANNQQQLSAIDKAIAEVKAHPQAFGLGRGLPMIGSTIDQRLDPAGVRARSLISNIGSMQIHDRTGAAMSVHEEKRLAGFVPQASDTPEKIIENLNQLKESLTEYNAAMQQGGAEPTTAGSPTSPAGHGRGGAGATDDINLGGPTRAQQLWDAAVAKYGKDRVLKEVGPRPEDDE